MTNALPAGRPEHVPEDRVVDFDVYSPNGVAAGFHKVFKTLQETQRHDLVWTPRNEGHWIVTRGRLMAKIFPDHQNYSNRIIVIPKSVGEQHQMLPTTLDPPIHAPFRALMQAGLTPDAVHRREGLVRHAAAALIDEFKHLGACDFSAAYAHKLPIHIFLGIVDLPLEDAPQLLYWAGQIVHPEADSVYAEAEKFFHDYLTPYIEQRSNGEGDDLLSTMVRGKVQGRSLTDGEKLSLCMQALLGGIDTVVNFLGFVFLHLAQNPQHREELIQTPALIPAAVEELLRRFPVVNVAREVRKPVECDGVVLKPGDIVMISTAFAGVDDQLSASPMEVDFHRPAQNNLTFGRGIHFCPGAHLARAEVRITIEEWLKRIPNFSLSPDARLSFRSGIVGALHGLKLVWPLAAEQ